MSTTTATHPSSATAATFSRSPTKPDLKPNPHPYAIKTTSTALLSRSNSSGHVTPSHYFYVPPSPSLSRSPTKSKSEYRGHRYSTSLTGELPSPLPVSPTRSQRSQSEDGASVGSSPARRTKRAETLPSIYPDAQEVGAPGAGTEDLPSNPKLWTPAQLSVYLMTALRVRSGEALSVPVPVARDIASWVRKEGVSGRTFLRWGEEDLEGLGINTLWRDALLNAARNLRQNVIRGRIWGTPTSPAGSDSGQAPAPHPYGSETYASSSSSLDLSDSGESGISPLRRSGALRARKNKGNGRVRGMVDKWERDSVGSVRSRDGSEGEQEEGSAHGSPNKVVKALPLLPDQRRESLASVQSDDAELSMEELLATVSVPDLKSGSWGARAWEDLDVGVTVKRIGESQSLDTVVKRRDANGSGNGFEASKRGSSSRVKAAGNDDRRVVTAIFAPHTEELEDIRKEVISEANGTANGEDQVQSEDWEKVIALEKTLETEVKGTKELLEEFKSRLEEVERRVSEMEERERLAAAMLADERAREAKKEKARIEDEQRLEGAAEALATNDISEKEREPPAAVTVDSAFTDAKTPPPALPRTILRRSPPSVDDDPGPVNLSDLPTYVALVGLGVCAVVLQVVLRRVAGRNFRS